MKKQQLFPAPVTNEGVSVALRRFLYLTAAINGAAIMIVEILGAKMLAPYVGTSHFVWTAQIAVTLVALSIGYYFGGWKVDRSPRLGWLYGCFFGAGLYLCLTLLVIKPICYWCLHFKLALGSLLASSFLYFVPLALLAMTCPYLIRFITDSLSGVGGNVGRLSAISTLGSVIGTILIGYVLIPFLSNTITMVLTAGGLMVLAAVYFYIWSGGFKPRFATTVVLIGGGALAYFSSHAEVYRDENMEELFRANSNFGLLQVLQHEDSDLRYYLNDFLTQNTYDTNLHQSTTMFTYMLHGLTRAYTTNLQNVLCIGLGVGIVPMQFAREGLKVDVVEINPAVVPLARKYFDLEPQRLNLNFGDGRHYVAQSQKQYDGIVLDAFLGESSPSHLMTREAFADMRRILRPSGSLVINCFGDFSPKKDFFVASLEKTLKSVFKSVRIHNEGHGGNVFMVASGADLEMRWQPDLDAIHPSCRWRVEASFGRVVETDARHGIVLTDDYNPVEFYDAVNREELRRMLANSMQQYALP